MAADRLISADSGGQDIPVGDAGKATEVCSVDRGTNEDVLTSGATGRPLPTERKNRENSESLPEENKCFAAGRSVLLRAADNRGHGNGD